MKGGKLVNKYLFEDLSTEVPRRSSERYDS